MIETDKRKAVFALRQEGTQVREIARLLGLSRNTGAGHHPAGRHATAVAHPRADQQPLDRLLHGSGSWASATRPGSLRSGPMNPAPRCSTTPA